MIPEITHQIWFQGWSELPSNYFSDVEKLYNMNKEWDHMKWDEQSLRAECEKFSADALAKFDGFDKMIQKVDFGRYVVLYNYGGISVDCDAECVRPLDNIPGLDRYDFIIGKNPLTNLENKLSSFGLSQDLVMVNNATLCCSKGNSMLENLIQFIIKNESWNEDIMMDTQLKTGPLIVSIFFNKNLDNRDILILDSEVFEPWGNITRRTILNHKYDQSWTQVGSIPVKIYRSLRNNLLLIMMFIIAFGVFLTFREIAIKYKE